MAEVQRARFNPGASRSVRLLRIPQLATLTALNSKNILRKFSGGVVVIRIGGASGVEVGEKNDRYGDALVATGDLSKSILLNGVGASSAPRAVKSSLTSNTAANPDVKPIPI